jgi:hypothetical protein
MEPVSAPHPELVTAAVSVRLPGKDGPILAAATAAGLDAILTGDKGTSVP